MSFIKKAISGALEPISDIAEKSITEANKTRREKERTKQRQSEDLKDTKIASAIWRPALSIAIKKSLIFYVASSFAFVVIILIGLMFNQPWAVLTEQSSLWFLLLDFWKWLGVSLFGFAALFLTTYSGGRSLEKIAINSAIRDSIGDTVNAIRGVKPVDNTNTPVVVRKPLEEAENNSDSPTKYIKRPNVIVPGDSNRNRPVIYKYTPSNWVYGRKSLDLLSKAHIDLQTLFHWFLERSEDDIAIIETVRDYETQLENIKKGASQIKLSRHLERPAMAVDFVVLNKYKKPVTILINDKKEWDIAYYKKATDLLKIGSAELNIPITCGIDWTTLVDGPHVELDRRFYPYVNNIDNITLS